jgi:hypothetical protein
MLSGMPILPMSCKSAPRRKKSDFGFAESQDVRKLAGNLSDANGMTLRLDVAQLERRRPTFKDGVVRLGEFSILALQAADEQGLVERNRAFVGDACQRVEPGGGGIQIVARKNFQDALDLAA